MGDLSYAAGKYGVAFEMMATSAKPIQERLLQAAIQIGPVTPEDFADPGLQERHNSLKARLTAVAGPEGSLQATISQMSDLEAEDCARQIVGISFDARALADERKNPG